MICVDDRIVNICTELFAFLKSGENTTTIHKKEVKRLDRQTVVQAEIDIGFFRIRMVWKPYQVVLGGPATGSDEGAATFIYLPFKSDRDANADTLEIKGFYSERGTDKIFNVIAPDEFKPKPTGTRRVVNTVKVSTGNPLANG